MRIVIYNDTKVSGIYWYYDLEKGKDFSDYKNETNQVIKKINFKNGVHLSRESENKFVWKDKYDSVIYELRKYECDGDKELIVSYYPK